MPCSLLQFSVVKLLNILSNIFHWIKFFYVKINTKNITHFFIYFFHLNSSFISNFSSSFSFSIILLFYYFLCHFRVSERIYFLKNSFKDFYDKILNQYSQEQLLPRIYYRLNRKFLNFLPIIHYGRSKRLNAEVAESSWIVGSVKHNVKVRNLRPSLSKDYRV